MDFGPVERISVHPADLNPADKGGGPRQQFSPIKRARLLPGNVVPLAGRPRTPRVTAGTNASMGRLGVLMTNIMMYANAYKDWEGTTVLKKQWIQVRKQPWKSAARNK